MDTQNLLRVNVLESAQVFETLGRLQADQQPEFGMMTPQHMVEHLAFAVGFSNGRGPQKHYFPPEKEQKIKAIIIDGKQEMPRGFKTPVLPPDGLPPLKCSSLQEAILFLEKELRFFNQYFIENPEARTINPAMGELNYNEWLIFHNSHFTHHFRQFGLM